VTSRREAVSNRITSEIVMAKYRSALPQLSNRLFLTDGGIETTLIFLEGLELPDFAAFHLLKTPEGTAALRKYFRTYAALAQKHDAGAVLESATWRANPDWAKRLGYSPEDLAAANRKSIELLEEIRREHENDKSPMVISGCVGPRGDGYVPGDAMSPDEAEAYHSEQIGVFAGTAADMVCAITMNYANEGTGVARAAEKAGMPVAISFTVETDGKLPTGQSLESAVGEVDEATSGYPSYYMINCAHPTHFDFVLGSGSGWQKRIRGLRANASKRSHVELNEAPDLDDGNPEELAAEYAELARRLPALNVMGGCCGTDHRHVEAIAVACKAR
jgi:S-methylmethionine-dependent homocysteine/selenocysteine methylase